MGFESPSEQDLRTQCDRYLGVRLLRQGRVKIVSNPRSHNWENNCDRAPVKMALIQDEGRSHFPRN
ncbi:hypothetical protein [Nostoc sp.]|uniref:hypothetical protein n=1 Tax=Nostoc sp. TaxID=1180 RepID=UPI002FFC02F7